MTYYELLGVTPAATPDEIRAAYRKLARQYHPDLNPGNTEAEAKFKVLSEAYSVLSDTEKRRKYDVFGDAAPQSAGNHAYGGGSNLDDLFDMIGSVFGSTIFKSEQVSKRSSTKKKSPKTKASAEVKTKSCSRCEGKGMVGGDFGFFAFKVACPGCLGTGKEIA